MLQVTAPRVSGDTLFGITDDARKELGIPLSEVKAVQVRGTSAGKTVALSVVIAAVGLAVVGAATMEAGGLNFGNEF